MVSTSPLVFRPSSGQRGMAALLFVGSWLVGVRAVAALAREVPRLKWALRAAEAASEPTTALWVLLVATLAACAAAGVILLATLLVLLLVEGSQVLVDDLGLVVDHGGLPKPLAHRLGAGRLTWKQVAGVTRKGGFFVVKGGAGERATDRPRDPDLRFLMVEDLERLILVILERSPHAKFDD